MNRHSLAIRILLLTCGLTTLAINPFFSLDPINLVKLLALSLCSFFLIPLILSQEGINSTKRLLIPTVGFLITIGATLFVKNESIEAGFWGTFGRNTGFLAFLCLTIILLCAASISDSKLSSIFIDGLLRVGYVVTGYTLIQIGDIDPVPWSQSLAFATLGNINFMSAFLGFCCTVMLFRSSCKTYQLSTRLFYLTMSSMNLAIVIYTGSIQGVGIILSAAAIWIGLELRIRGNNWLFSAYIISFFGAVLLVSKGLVGAGPLSVLKQESVLFRTDYWRTAIEMVKANPLGVGLDSYGDFYKQYRDTLATTRTGPERVSNTAHNIFLDVATGGGVVAVSFFIIFFIFAFTSFANVVKSKENLDNNLKELFLLNCGFLFFCLISINQLGVSVWGFAFLGLLFGRSTEIIRQQVSMKVNPRVRVSRSNSVSGNAKPSGAYDQSTFSLSICSALIGFCLAIPPNLADGRFAQALKSNNLERMESAAFSVGGSAVLRDRYLSSIVSNNGIESSKTLEIAERIIERDSRNEFALRIISISEFASNSERVKALQKLRQIDPQNKGLQDDLESELTALR